MTHQAYFDRLLADIPVLKDIRFIDILHDGGSIPIKDIDRVHKVQLGTADPIFDIVSKDGEVLHALTPTEPALAQQFRRRVADLVQQAKELGEPSGSRADRLKQVLKQGRSTYTSINVDGPEGEGG